MNTPVDAPIVLPSELGSIRYQTSTARTMRTPLASETHLLCDSIPPGRVTPTIPRIAKTSAANATTVPIQRTIPPVEPAETPSSQLDLAVEAFARSYVNSTVVPVAGEVIVSPRVINPIV